MAQSADRRDRGEASAESRLAVLERELHEATRELHGLHRDVQTLHERLRSQVAERQELLTVVSHELRTPITVIRGYARLLLEEAAGPLNEKQRHYLAEAAEGCRRLDAFVERVLTAAQTPRGEQALEVCSTGLSSLLGEVVRSLAPVAQERSLRVEVEVVPADLRARCDRGAVERVLGNLLGNALRYAAEGGRVGIDAREVERGGRRVVEVAVSDDGPGVAPEDRGRIFDAYVRGSRERGGGLGLGLAISRRLVEAHGGEIALSECREGGARFHFTLPRAET